MALDSNFALFCHKSRHFPAKICISLAKDGVLIKSGTALARIRYIPSQILAIGLSILYAYNDFNVSIAWHCPAFHYNFKMALSRHLGLFSLVTEATYFT